MKIFGISLAGTGQGEPSHGDFHFRVDNNHSCMSWLQHLNAAFGQYVAIESKLAQTVGIFEKR